MKKNKITILITTLIVLLTFIYGFIDGGSPQAARSKRYDDKRIQDIQMLNNWINSYYNKNEVLPNTVLEASTSYNISGNIKIPTDPETNRDYQYQTIDEKRYKICAKFSTNTTNNSPQYLMDYAHPSGHYCLTFDRAKY